MHMMIINLSIITLKTSTKTNRLEAYESVMLVIDNDCDELNMAVTYNGNGS